MQKKIIALAVASLASGAALAQTNVTIYGIADAGYVYSYGSPGQLPGNNFKNPAIDPATGGSGIKGKNTFSGIQSGLLAGSRIGFKGEEALGNGLKAIFTLEYAIELDNNTGIGTGTTPYVSTNAVTGQTTSGPVLNARQQFVGLSSATLGTVALGRQYAPGYVASVNNDAFGGALFSPQSFLTANAGNTITPNSGARWNNAITYTSPNWGGFTGKAIYSFGEQNKDGSFLSGTGNGTGSGTTDNSRWGLGFNFATGPVNVDLLYQVRQQVTAQSLPLGTNQRSLFPTNEAAVLAGVAPNQFVYGKPYGSDINEWYIGGSFDLKVVKLMASYQGQNDRNRYNLDNQTWSVGAVIPILSASNIHLSYAQQMWDQGSFYSRTGYLEVPGATYQTTLQGNLLNQNSQAAALGWTTKMSKRTTLYAGYVWVDNDKASTAQSPLAGTPVTGARNEQNQTFLAGINHTF